MGNLVRHGTHGVASSYEGVSMSWPMDKVAIYRLARQTSNAKRTFLECALATVAMKDRVTIGSVTKSQKTKVLDDKKSGSLACMTTSSRLLDFRSMEAPYFPVVS